MGKKLALVKLFEKARETRSDSPRAESIEHRAFDPNTNKQVLDIDLEGAWVTIRHIARGTTILIPAANVRYAQPLDDAKSKGGRDG